MEQTAFGKVASLVRKLSSTDPTDEAVQDIVKEIESGVTIASDSSLEDMKYLREQILKLRQSAEIPLQNYRRIASILDGLQKVLILAERPQYADIRPRIAAVVGKVAGIFAEVDTVSDLDKPLDAIEKAVHSLYGDQGQNSTYYFDRRGKGHHEKK